MDIKVREVTADEKSSQQIEQELLDKHEEKFQSETEQESIEVKAVEPEAEVEVKEDNTQEEAPVEEVVEEQPPQLDAPPELNEDEVLSYIGKRYGKEINSIDELISKREDSEPLPEDVAAYLKYKKETGRGFNDFAKLQKDYSDLSPDALLREYYTITEEGLDSEDIDDMMDEFTVDEEIHEPTDIKKIKLAKKKEIAKAKKFLRQQQEQYKQPLESRERSASESDDELIEYRQYLESAKTQQEEANHKREWFVKKSDEVFSSEFKGFKFTIGEDEVVYTPGSASELRKSQETPLNFVNKYLDSSGFIKDAEGYHKSLAVAMNPEKFAQFFYEQGKSKATDDVIRKTKNINMSERTAPEVSSKSGLQVKSVSQPSSSGLKIKSIKRS
jgi:predicted hydrocarbon binding protein